MHARTGQQQIFGKGDALDQQIGHPKVFQPHDDPSHREEICLLLQTIVAVIGPSITGLNAQQRKEVPDQVV
jgi:hypothetical protein